MYENESRVEKVEQSYQSKWFKIPLLIGSIMVGLGFLLMSSYWIVMIITIYVETANALLPAFLVINSVSTYTSLIGMILLITGYFGLALNTNGIGKITLIVGAVAFLLQILIEIGMIIVNFLVIPRFFDPSGDPASFGIMLATLGFIYTLEKFIAFTFVFFVVSFSKGELKNSNTDYRISTKSAFILPLWIVIMIITLILGLLIPPGLIYLTIYMSAIIAFCLNQAAYSIDFLVKVVKI